MCALSAFSVAKHLWAATGIQHARASAFNYFFIFESKPSSLVNQIVFSIAPCIANLHESVVLFLRCLVFRLICLVFRLRCLVFWLLVFWQESIAARWPASAQCNRFKNKTTRLDKIARSEHFPVQWCTLASIFILKWGAVRRNEKQIILLFDETKKNKFGFWAECGRILGPPAHWELLFEFR